jgi:hypothetical protein
MRLHCHKNNLIYWWKRFNFNGLFLALLRKEGFTLLGRLKEVCYTVF